MKHLITSEYKELKQIIVHKPSGEQERGIPWSFDHPFFEPFQDQNAISLIEITKDHNELTDFLSSEIGEQNVFTIIQLLTEIFELSDLPQRQKILKDFVGVKDMNKYEQYVTYLNDKNLSLETYPAKEIASDLIEGCPRTWEINNGIVSPSIFPPKRSMMYSRDSSAVLPIGIIINSMSSPWRKWEPAIMRTIYKFHPMFKEDTIILDLLDTQRGVKVDPAILLNWDYILEGGNILVLREDTIAIGVGHRASVYSNRANRLAFELLVHNIFKVDTQNKIQKIYMVNLPDIAGFIHLDTVFNMFGEKSAISMPYVFGYPDRPMRVFTPFIKYIREEMATRKTDLSKLLTEEDIENMGKVEVYTRDMFNKSGEVTRVAQKAKYFIEQLVDDDIVSLNNIVWVGGEEKDHSNSLEYLRVALREQSNQAGNVFTTKPFHVVAYHRNPFTLSLLEKKLHSLSSNALLKKMSSNELRTRGGGPHCLTLPILRNL